MEVRKRIWKKGRDLRVPLFVKEGYFVEVISVNSPQSAWGWSNGSVWRGPALQAGGPKFESQTLSVAP